MSEEQWTEPSNLIVEQIEIGPMQNFTYVIGCRRTHEVVIVDPAWDVTNLVEHINNKGSPFKHNTFVFWNIVVTTPRRVCSQPNRTGP